MTNKILWIKLILLVLIFFFLIAIGVRMFTTGVGGLGISGKRFKNDDIRLNKNFENVSLINIDLTVDEVEIVESKAEDSVSVVYYSRRKIEKFYPVMEYQEGKLTIKAPPSRNFNMGWSGGKLVVNVPKESALKYHIENVSGKVSLDAGSQQAQITTVSGSVRVNEAGEEISVESVSGSIRIAEAFFKTSAKSTSGSIRVTADRYSTGGVEAESTSGSVKVYLPKDCGYHLDYQSSSGSIKDEIRDIDLDNNGTLLMDDETIPIRVLTTSGSIKILEAIKSDDSAP